MLGQCGGVALTQVEPHQCPSNGVVTAVAGRRRVLPFTFDAHLHLEALGRAEWLNRDEVRRRLEASN